jgi:hypothetical protein
LFSEEKKQKTFIFLSVRTIPAMAGIVEAADNEKIRPFMRSPVGWDALWHPTNFTTPSDNVAWAKLGCAPSRRPQPALGRIWPKADWRLCGLRRLMQTFSPDLHNNKKGFRFP